MSDFVSRLRVEHAELKDKIKKLAAFITDTDVFKTLPLGERRLLGEQLRFMHAYGQILEKRVAIYEVNAEQGFRDLQKLKINSGTEGTDAGN